MIPFTQYLRPHGRSKPVTIERPEDIERLARVLIDGGCRFECEELQTGDVSFTVEVCDRGEYIPLSGEVCANGPDVPAAVDRLVVSAHDAFSNFEQITTTPAVKGGSE